MLLVILKFTVKKAIKRKGDKLYFNWKGYDSSFKSCIDKKEGKNERIFFKTKILGRKSES